MKSLLVFAATILVSVQTAIGQVRTVSDLRFTLDEWEFVPTLIGTQVESFVALRDPDQAVGDNVTAVWFLRIDDRDWQTYAWHDQDNLKAVAHIKGTLELDDSTDASWPVAEAQQGVDVTEATEPDQFGTGVFPDDPLLPVIESQTDPTELLSVLVSAGWEASDADLFKSECRQDQLLSDMADGFVLELAEDGAGVDVIGDAIDDTVCQGGGGGGGCTPRTIIGGVWQSGCVDTTGWVLTGTGTGVTMGQCWPENCWSGAFFHYERCRVRKIYANCTTCLMVQQRFNNCTASVCELDTSTPLGPPPCGAVPPGYTPPAGPSIGSPCTAANPDCEGWTDWSPDVEDVCP